MGLPAGDHDDAAHERFAGATSAMQAVAFHKAEIARFLVAGWASEDRGLTCTLIDQARKTFGTDGTEKMTLRCILRAVAGVEPMNFAPALLPAHTRAGSPPAEFSPEAWAYFRLYTDNGSAFAGHLVEGGADFKWRGKAAAKPGVKPLGVCYHLVINRKFAMPKNAKATIAERTFATLYRVIDDRP